MKKIIFALCFIILASCSQNNATNSSENTETSSEIITQNGNISSENLPASENFQKVLDSASKKITQTESFNMCIKSYINSCLDATASEIANTTKDASFCNELVSEISRDSCRFGVVVSDMHSHKDSEKCEIIQDQDLKDSCKIAVIETTAMETGDLNACEKIVDIYKENPEKSLDYKEMCMMRIISVQETIEWEQCNTFTLDNYKEMCISLSSRDEAAPIDESPIEE